MEKLEKLKELYSSHSTTELINILIDEKLLFKTNVSDKKTNNINVSDTINKYMRAYKREWNSRPENKEKLREYNKNYRKANPEKFKACRERYWLKKAGCLT